MRNVARVGIDLAKDVFHVTALDGAVVGGFAFVREQMEHCRCCD